MTDVMQTQGQGHASRSLDLPLNFVSAPYLMNSLKDSHLTLINCPSQRNDLQNS